MYIKTDLDYTEDLNQYMSDWIIFHYYSPEMCELRKQDRYIHKQLQELAIRLNKGQKIDWDNKEQAKYTIIYKDGKFVCYKTSDIFYLSQITCLDKNFLNIAKEEIGEDRLKQLWKYGIL